MADDTGTAAVADKAAAAPASRVTQRSASPPVDLALTADESARLADLSAKKPNPNVLPADVRTEDEEAEFRVLAKREADASRWAALEAARPAARLNPKQRLDQLRNIPGEGADIERRRLEELVHDEDRIAVLKGMDKRVEEEDAELAMLQARVAEARAAGGFDPNG